MNQLLSHSVDPTKLSPTETNLLEHPPHLPYHKLSCNSLKRLASSDVWSATADQVWLEFLGVQNCKNRPAPFVEAIPVTFWLSRSSKKHDQNGVSQPGVCRCQRSNQTVAYTAIREQCSSGSKATVGPSVFSSPLCDNKDGPIDCDSSLDSRHTSPSSEKLSRFDPSDHRHQDHDGNSSVHSHNEPDRHPTRLSLSGIPHHSNGSRHSKKLNRTESLHESDSAELSSSPHSLSTKSDPLRDAYSHEVSDPHNGDRRRGKKVEQYPGVYRPETDVIYQQARQRQDKQKDCSRSSSSPPLGHGEVQGRRREESRERRSKERRIRHSSSSSIEGGGGGGKKNREADGRSSAEGQVSSERSTDERKNARESKKVEDYYYTDDRTKPKGRDDELSNLRKSRKSSSSSSEWAPMGSGRSRERRFQRSASRESRNFDRQDLEKHSPRERYNEERVSPRAERSSRDNRGRRSSRDPRDGSRESTDRRHEMLEAHVYERSPIRSKTRDIMDGFPLNQKGFHMDRDGGMSEDSRHRHRSRGVEADPRQKHERVEDGDNQRFKYNHDDPEQRSRLSDSPRSRHNDADCDNDRFSPTSQSSQDMNAIEVTQNMLNEQVDATLMKSSLPPESSKRLPPEGCKAQDDVCQHCTQQAPLPEKHLCLLTKIHGKLRVQLNHFQYLFLLRVSESFSAFQNDLSAILLSVASNPSTSNKNSFKKAPVKESPSVTVIPLILKELEFAVVCPYQMHQRTFSDDFSVISPFLQGFTGQDAVFGDDGDGTCFPQLVDTKGRSYFKC